MSDSVNSPERQDPTDGDERSAADGPAGSQPEAQVEPQPEPKPEAQADRLAQPVDAEQLPRLPFPVVGVGASAGGLEAFIEFVTAMRPDSGMAFVFVQHLPPERESLMANILATKTKMVVLQVEDGMEVKPDHLYVIRPGHVLTIKDARFHLGLQLGNRSANRPVDDFFKSLAEEQRERAVAVLLSGMGSNGAAGAQAVKAVGGLCVAQDPDTAQFPSMPRHLIDQGYADYILPPAEMPEVLLQYAGHPYARENHRDADEHIRRNASHLREILAVLRTRTRQDFSGYKKPTMLRRIHRRMGLARLTDMGEYARLLRQSPIEVQSLADDLLIHVTGFFRDAEAWDALRDQVVVPLIARREPDSEVRAWVTACSSGEEAYSLAMLLVEEAERAGKPLGIKVFATDMADRTLSHARAGVYPGGIESEIDPQRLERFFEKEDGLYRVKQPLRECVVFAPQNLLSDPPFSRLDIISCRNLLIYLEPEVQLRVLSLLHFGLREGGALFLGSSETAAGVDELYELVDKRARIFRRLGPTRHGALDFPLPHALRGAAAEGARGTVEGAGGGGGDGGAAAGVRQSLVMERRRGAGRPSIGVITHRTLLEQHVKAAVTVDRDQRVLYFHGNTAPFLEQPPGEPTRDLMALVRERLRGSVRVALHRCAAEQAAVTVMDGWVETAPGSQARAALTASPVSSDDPSHPEYFVVSFELLDELHGGGTPPEGDGNGGELHRVRDELQTTIEELQTSNEELKASNEEVTSINEELQSTNEELETSKEEMQSLNEELTTLNAQLQAKMEEHQDARNDLTALLSSTAIAVLFLDGGFRIRRYTPAVRELLDLIPGDVGRPLKDLHRKFEDPHLDEDVRAVLERLVPVEREVAAANGRYYARRVLPYRTVDDRIDGIVVTFFDITALRRAEREAAAARTYAESIVETLHEPLLVLNQDLTVRSANEAFYRQFKVGRGDTHGRRVYDLGNGQWDIPTLRTALEEVLPKSKVFTDYEVDHEFEGLGRRLMLLNGRQLDHVQLILLGIRDVTAERQTEAALREREARFRTLVQNLRDYAILMTDPAGVITEWAEGARNVLGYAAEEAVGKHVSLIYTPEQVAGGYVKREFAEAAETGRAEREDWRMRKGGERFWANEIVNAVPGPDGEVTAFAKITSDLGVRKRAEVALRETEARFRGVADLVPDLLWQSDPVGQGVWHNRRWLEYTGQTPEQAKGQGWMDAIHPDDRERSKVDFLRAMGTGEPLRQELRLRRASDGTYRWFLVQVQPLREAGDDGGRIVAWLGSATDVHEQRTAMDALREGDERFRLVFEGARDFAMIMLDPDNKITAWNLGAERVTGFGRNEVIGREGTILFTPEDRSAGAVEKELSQARANDSAMDERWHLRKDGGRFWGSGVMTALRNLDGSLRGFVKVLRDETARKEAEDALQSAKESAELANRMKDQFLATLSHELRTPMAAMLIWARMLRTGKADPAQVNEGLDAIVRAAESQEQLIEDLLDTSRITSGKLRLQPREVKLAAVVAEAADSVLPAAEAKGVVVATDLDPGAGVVRADPDRLRQVFWNLLSNAVKFTPEGGTVDVSLRRMGSAVEIRVADTGQGIAARFLPYVFEPFRQADGSSTRRHGGLGLGLAIAKQLVELHGGTIHAESPGPGKGSVFTVRLPLPRMRLREVPAGVRDGGDARPNRAGPPLAGVRVLLVEDEPETRNALVVLLIGAGAQVTAVASADAALAAYLKSRPDVLLSDIGLPDTDGYALLGKIRRREAAAAKAGGKAGGATTAPVPAVALTAFARDEDRRAAEEAGFGHYLAKPAAPEELLAALREAVERGATGGASGGGPTGPSSVD